MSYLNANQIRELCAAGEMLDYDPANINAASMDIRMGREVLIESSRAVPRVIDFRARDKLDLETINILSTDGIILHPGEFFLAHTIERCNFADNTAALFRIKSSMGRIGLEHLDAGWVDPGFHGSLTLEFKVVNTSHPIRLRHGDPIGQLIFFKGEHVAPEDSYRVKGNYNGHAGVAQVGYKNG